MSTSGSSDYTNTRNELVYAMLRKCGMLAEGEDASAQMMSDATGDLERIVKAWQAEGLHLWKYAEYKLFLETGKSKYLMGSAGDRAVNEDDLTTTTLSAASSDSDSTITVASIAGASDGDYVGVVVDDLTTQWTTIDGAPSGSTITLSEALDDSAASGNKVYIFTNKAVRPLQVTHGRVQVDTTSETVLDIVGREDYFSLANKSSAGVPNQIYYNPSLVNGTLYVWPTVADERQYLNLTVQQPIEDFDSAGNNPDLPVEWFQALIWNGALELAPEYGVDDGMFVMIKERAEYWYNKLLDYDTEQANIIFTVGND